MATSSFGQCSGGTLKGTFDHCPRPSFGDRNLDATDRSGKSAPSPEACRGSAGLVFLE